MSQEEELSVVVDLTYVRVDKKQHYICVFVDLYNREIVGFSTGENKDALLVYRALSSIKGNLHTIKMFHTDRGREFKNEVIDEALETLKGCPYDKAVAEATFKIIKTEFVKKRHFDGLEELHREFTDYVHWFNHVRIHSTLDYLSPVEYKLMHLKKTVQFSVDNPTLYFD